MMINLQQPFLGVPALRSLVRKLTKPGKLSNAIANVDKYVLNNTLAASIVKADEYIQHHPGLRYVMSSDVEMELNTIRRFLNTDLIARTMVDTVELEKSKHRLMDPDAKFQTHLDDHLKKVETIKATTGAINFSEPSTIDSLKARFQNKTEALPNTSVALSHIVQHLPQYSGLADLAEEINKELGAILSGKDLP